MYDVFCIIKFIYYTGNERAVRLTHYIFNIFQIPGHWYNPSLFSHFYMHLGTFCLHLRCIPAASSGM